MSLGMDSQCYLCHFRRNVETARSFGDEEKATGFARDLMALYLRTPADAASPTVAPATTDLFRKHFGLPADRYREEKAASNRYILARMDAIRHQMEASDDPVYAGIQMAILGNYIDFSALQGEVDFPTLDKMLCSADKLVLDWEAYRQLRRDLKNGQRLLYLTDNAGEIGIDRILAEIIHRQFPHLQITFCVRGGPALNDATREDARAVGLPFPVIDNGNTVPGTDLKQLSEEARAAMDAADVIIAKGQGNTETLLGCGYNIYYLFLVKCPRFIQHFNRPKLTPMLLREKGEHNTTKEG